MLCISPKKRRRLSRACRAASIALVANLAAAQDGGWERDAAPLLDGFVNMYNPCVIEVDDAPRYRMWFFGWGASQTNEDIPGCDAIFHARSDDLVTWEVYAGEHGGEARWDRERDVEQWVPVLTAGDRWYEAWHVGDPTVVEVRGNHRQSSR